VAKKIEPAIDDVLGGAYSLVIGKGATTVLKLGESKRRSAARVEAPKAPRGGGVGGPIMEGSDGPLPRNFFDFLTENSEFWCIMGGASALYVATAQESDAEDEGRERALVKDDILH